MRDDSEEAQARHEARAGRCGHYVVTDVRGNMVEKLRQLLPPAGNVMRVHGDCADVDINRQMFDVRKRTFLECPEKAAERRHRAILVRMADPALVAKYARMEAEARSQIARDGLVEPLVLGPKAAELGIHVRQLAPLVVERAEQDRDALYRAWGWQEAQRVRESQQ